MHDIPGRRIDRPRRAKLLSNSKKLRCKRSSENIAGPRRENDRNSIEKSKVAASESDNVLPKHDMPETKETELTHI